MRQRFLVRAMAKVALHLDWAGRGLAARVVYDADHLAHAAAAAAIHRGTAVSDDRLRLRTAALAEHFSDGRADDVRRQLETLVLPPTRRGQRIRRLAPGVRAVVAFHGPTRGPVRDPILRALAPPEPPRAS